MSSTPETSIPQQHPKLLELLPKLDALEKSLLTADPMMPVHLKEVHKYLIQFEELSHLLTEDQISIILEGQQKKLGVLLAAETAKTKGSTKIKGGVTADDL